MPPILQIASDSDLDVTLEDFRMRKERRDSTGPKYMCTIDDCGAQFKRLDHLDRHEYHHTNIRKHTCTYDGCDKVYSTLTHLKRHLRTIHERPVPPQKTIKCTLQECTKLFTSTGNMQRHVREAHEAPRLYTCNQCQSNFRKKMMLRRHEIQQHTQAYPYRCEKCTRGFFQEWQKESHQRSCKTYGCPKCDQYFDKWTLYTKHCRETLHGRDRLKCEHCERSYDKPSDLSKHVAAKHVTETTAFVCTEPDCNRSYSYERNLRQHVLTAHTGKRFLCVAVGCSRCFSSAQNLSKHFLRDHTAKDRLAHQKKRTAITTAVVLKKKRKRRRDAGQKIRSRLSELSSLVLDRSTDKEVRERQPNVLSIVSKELLQQEQTQNESDDSAIEELLAETLKDLDELNE